MRQLNLFLLKTLAITQLISWTAFAETPQQKAPDINPQIWQKIDQLNKTLKTANGNVDKLSATLIAADQIIKPENFDADYQKIRAWSFEHDFKLAESLVKRAEPLFELAFDGDYDIYKIRFETFAKLARPKSELAQMLEEYVKYANFVLSINPSIESHCTIAFNSGGKTKENSPRSKRFATSKWASYSRSWKDPVLKEVATRFAKCFDDIVASQSKR